MSDDVADERPAETREQRRRRLAAVFGDDVLPETTSDERGPEAPEVGDRAERWLQEQVPPHHG